MTKEEAIAHFDTLKTPQERIAYLKTVPDSLLYQIGESPEGSRINEAVRVDRTKIAIENIEAAEMESDYILCGRYPEIDPKTWPKEDPYVVINKKLEDAKKDLQELLGT